MSEGHSYLSILERYKDSQGPYQLGLETRQGKERLVWVLLASVFLGGKFGFRT